MSDFELSNFQRKKIIRVFSTFFDINNDGVIEWEDFKIAVEKIRQLHCWDQDGDKHKTALETIRLIWDGLKEFADENQDGKITQDEWFQMWTESVKAVKANRSVPDWQQKYMNFMFDVNDTSGDERIDKSEYTIVYTSYGLSKEECETAFDKFATDGTVDRDSFNQLWMEYFTSDDPQSKGSFLFGMLDD